MRSRGLYTIMEQANRIYGQNLLQLGLAFASTRFPRTRFVVLEPPGTRTPLFGPSMSFDVAREVLRFGYSSTLQWLATQGKALPDHLCAEPAPVNGAAGRPTRPRSRLARAWSQGARALAEHCNLALP